MSNGPESESASLGSTLKRGLLTIAAVPVGVSLGLVIAIFVVGAPHSMPGLLMHAPERVRDVAGLAVVVATPIVLIYLIWREPLRQAMSGGAEPAAEAGIRPVATPDDALIAAYRRKTSDELKAMLDTEDRALYPATTYQLVKLVLEERG